MPDSGPIIGTVYTAYLPDDTELIALGWTHVRFYQASTKTGSYTLQTTTALSAGTKDYSYNKTTGLSTDWGYHCLYNGSSESAGTEPIQLGAFRLTRLVLRQEVGKLLRIMETADITTVTDSDTIVISSFIDPDADAWRYSNRYLRCYAGTAIGQTRRSRAGDSSPAGYVPASGTLNVNRATSPAWVAGDSLELWRPKGDEDPSLMVDRAINFSSHLLWFEDVFYVTLDAGVTEYALPSVLFKEEMVKTVEWASYDYPQAPQWAPVPFARTYTNAGQVWVSIQGGGGIWPRPMTSGTVIRIVVNRTGKALDTDTEYWEGINREWAVAQVAYTFLLMLGSPSGFSEDILDVKQSLQFYGELLDSLRAVHMPRGGIREELAQ